MLISFRIKYVTGMNCFQHSNIRIMYLTIVQSQSSKNLYHTRYDHSRIETSSDAAST